MKNLPIALALCCLLGSAAVADANAMCLDTWTSATPEKTILPTGWIVLSGGGETRGLLRRLATLSPALVRDGERVPLTVMAVHDGAFNVTQALLKPTRALTTGATYSLSLTSPDPLRARVPKRLTNLSWRVAAKGIARTPRWRGPPTVEGSRYTSYGCGPARYIDVRLPVAHDELLGALVEVRRVGSTEPPSRFLVRVRDGVIALGHGMCSGPFTFAEGAKYTIRVLSVLDARGQSLPAPAHLLEARSPVYSGF